MGSASCSHYWSRAQLNDIKAQMAKGDGKCYLTGRQLWDPKKLGEMDVLREAHRREVDEARHEYGNRYDTGSYAGFTDGFQVERRIFPTRYEAESYVYDKNGWKGDAWAVMVAPEPPKEPAAIGKLNDRAAELRKELQAIAPAAIARCKAVKSKTRGCAKCGSSISVAHIRSTACPVCGDGEFVYIAGDIEKRARLQAKITDLEAQATKLREEYHADVVKKATPEACGWLIGGFVPS